MATTFTSAGTGDWSNAATWDVGSGYPGSGGSGDTVIIAGHTVTLDATAITTLGTSTLVSITGNNASSVLNITATAAITFTGSTGLTYSSTGTSGFVRVSGGTTTLTGPGSGTCISNTSTGYAIVQSSSGATVVSNSGGIAISAPNGRGISASGTGATQITGTISCSGDGIGVLSSSTSTSSSIVGALTSSGASAAKPLQISAGTWAVSGCNIAVTTSGAFTLTGGTINYTCSGNTVETSSLGNMVVNSGGTFNWTGTVTISATKDVSLNIIAGTTNFGSGGSALTITNSGRFLVRRHGGTLNVPGSGSTCAINNQAGASALAMCHGQDISSVITYNNLSAGNIKDTVAILGVTGTYTGSGGGPTRRIIQPVIQ